MPTIHNYIFLCDSCLRLNVSAPDVHTALQRLTSNFDKIEYIGLNPKIQSYEYEPREPFLSQPFDKGSVTIRFKPAAIKDERSVANPVTELEKIKNGLVREMAKGMGVSA